MPLSGWLRSAAWAPLHSGTVSSPQAWSARLAWNLRTSFLVSPAGSEGQPEYIDDFDQLDASVGYAVNDNVTVFAEALKLTDEPLRRYSQPGYKIEEYSINGVRFFAGVRARF